MGTHPIFESDFDCLTDWKMGVQNIHQFVRTRAQVDDKVFTHKLNNFLKIASRERDKTRVIIDGNNFAFVLLRESYSPGNSIQLHMSHILRDISVSAAIVKGVHARVLYL